MSNSIVKNQVFSKECIDWAEMSIYEQSESLLEHTLYNKGLLHLDHLVNPLEEVDRPLTDAYILPPGDAPGMINKFNGNVSEKYEAPLIITEKVLREIFDNREEVHIFIGETEHEGIVFMYVNPLNKEYYIISNCDDAQHITQEIFLANRNFYNENLKSILDRFIPDGDPDPGNTKRFIVKNYIYTEFLRQYGQDTGAKFVVRFYPAMHTIADKYNNRLTFIMVVEKYVKNELVACEKTGLYDRNGLCPPGTC